MRAWVGWAAGAAVLVGAAAVAQQRGGRPSPECRQQLMEMCSGAGGGMRQCLRTAFPKFSDDCRKAASERAMARAERPTGMQEFAYGADPKQKLDLIVPAGVTKAPLLFFVHGGGWSIGDKAAGEATKAPWANGLGWAFASVNYRLVPQATVEQQAADLANALAWARANAAKQGLDPDRVVLMGHSAGAHLIALLGTDTSYLAKAGVPLSAIKGVILLDGAGYDIAPQMASGRNPVESMYDAAFGKDVARQKALSPTLHAAAPNVANWLILPIERRADSQTQSKELAAALAKAGASAKVVVVPDKTHGSLNKEIGEKGDFATGEVERFLASVR
nr:alpha/beta hydrolase [uncultured Sphingomonas sp.]